MELLILALLVVPILATVRAAKSGRRGWAIGIGVSILVFPVSVILAVVYLAAVHPKSSAGDADPADIRQPEQTPGWFDDPLGRNQLRLWDGSSWTEHVSNNGIATTDPPTPG